MHRVAHGLLHGSSPRAWGTPWRRPGPAGNARFIPTGVGNTRSGSQARRQDPVHPHGRGEHIDMPVPRPSAYGSSPRAWGTPAHPPRETLKPRFIPTGVGNTLLAKRKQPRRTGSSPRAWGTRARDAHAHAHQRFIPTGVGNTSRRSARQIQGSVHPHGRGEHQIDALVSHAPPGSSPRAWGTHHFRVDGLDERRFIPTGVGNTSPAGARPRCSAVHPHGRGEHRTATVTCDNVSGSSPRAWGTRPGYRAACRPDRFIPTGVGNTPPWADARRALPVHPHGRGEHVSRARDDVLATGSSPRAWGTHRA